MNGKHIKVQIYGASFDRLKDEMVADKMLTSMVDAAGMRQLDDPWVYDVRKTLEAYGLKPDADEPEGVTGVVVLSTSHAAVHTWPHRGYAVIDLFSCSDFETAPVEKAIKDAYGPERVAIHDLSHALAMPAVMASES